MDRHIDPLATSTPFNREPARRRLGGWIAPCLVLTSMVLAGCQYMPKQIGSWFGGGADTGSSPPPREAGAGSSPAPREGAAGTSAAPRDGDASAANTTGARRDGGAGSSPAPRNAAGGSGTGSTDTAAAAASNGTAISRDEVMSMLTRSDPKACTVTTDATFGETVSIYGRIGLGQVQTLARAAVVSDAELQSALDALRPLLRELSRRTNWLPMDAEKMIGEQLFERTGLKPWTPPARQRRLLDETIMPMFNELKRYAAEEVKSPLPFELRVVNDDVSKTPQATAGGIVLIPRAMLSSLSTVKDPKPIVAFMLAHEFSHSLRRHKTKLTQQSLVDSITKIKEYRKLAREAKAGFGALTSIDQLISFSASNVTSLMNEVCTARNWIPNLEQEQESEADVCGSLLLHRLGEASGKRYSALDGYRAYIAAKLADDAPAAQRKGICTVKTTHPSTEDREKNLREYSSALAAAAAR